MSLGEIPNTGTKNVSLANILNNEAGNYLVFCFAQNVYYHFYGVINTSYFNKALISVKTNGINITMNNSVLTITNQTGYNLEFFLRVIRS